MKKILALLLGACLLVSLTAGCSTESKPLNIAIPGTGTTESGGSESGSAPPLSEVRAIIFDEVKNELGGDYTGMPGAKGTTSLQLTLYETAPGVFTGNGILSVSMAMGFGGLASVSTTSMQRLFFQDLKPGGGECTALTFTDAKTSMSMSGEHMGAYTTHNLFTLISPIDCSFTLDGDPTVATLKIGLHPAFSGSYEMVSPAAPRTDQLDGRCISVNSTYKESGKDYNRESRAMLTATLVSGLDYKGDFCAYGSGTGRPYIDEAVNFKLVPFEEQSYKSAGGSLPGSFDAFGVIKSSGGDYIVLIDDEWTLVEDVSSDAVFTGTLLPANEADGKMKLADDSKRLMKLLYDNPDPSQHGNKELPVDYFGKPAWYPDWLMPDPIGPSGWFSTSMPKDQQFYKYVLGYEESASPWQTFSAYKSFYEDLGGVEIYSDDSEDTSSTNVGVFYYSEGVYSFEVTISAWVNRVMLTIT